MFNFTTPPPLSLYIHIPWCIHKCPYCDFNSYQIQGNIPENEYIIALLTDLEQDLHRIEKERVVQSIFIGGGTPSVLSPKAIDHLLSGIRTRLSVAVDAEITLEANPGTIDNTHFQGFREAGINRLSLGIQSFNERILQNLGRIHGRMVAINSLEIARQADFNTINLDLMFGLPTQTIEGALEDLHTAMIFKPSLLCWYQLTIEPNTLFYHQPPLNLPDEDRLWEMQNLGQQYLAQQGYIQYEISAYAKPGEQCQHNLNYWKFGDYLGIGAGAHSKISDSTLGTITRLSKQRHPQTYLQLAHTPAIIAHCTELSLEEVILEFMMNALRLFEGFTDQEFTKNTGLSMAHIEETIQQLCMQGWLKDKNSIGRRRIKTTETSICFLNDLLESFVP